MRVKIAMFLAAALVLCLAPVAGATTWGEVAFTPNCEGWVASGDVHFHPMRLSADVDYVVTLSQNGTVLETYSGVVTITQAYPYLELYGAWAGELCGDYVASGYFHLQTPDNDVATATVAFTCDCPDEDACHYTPGYWKNHPEAWPMMSVTLGGVTYTQAQAIAIMDTPVGGDVTIILAYHLIAAKLNVANGASDSIQDAIDAADAYLVAHPLYSKPGKLDKAEGVMIKDELVGYNEMGCPDGFDDPAKGLGGTDESLNPAGEEISSWGALKGAYR